MSYTHLNSDYSNSELINLIDLCTSLLKANIPLKHKSNIAIRQMSLIKEFSIRIRNNVTYQTKNNFKWYYRLGKYIRNKFSISRVISDNISYKRYFRTKRKDFQIDHNVIYIGISHKIHKFYDRSRSFIVNLLQKVDQNSVLFSKSYLGRKK